MQKYVTFSFGVHQVANNVCIKKKKISICIMQPLHLSKACTFSTSQIYVCVSTSIFPLWNKAST